MRGTSEQIFFREIAKYPRLNKWEQEDEIKKIFLYRETLKLATTSHNPEIAAYLKLIKIRNAAIKETGNKPVEYKWAELAQLSVRELDKLIKAGLSEWAKLATVSVFHLARIQNQAIQARQKLALHNLYLVVKIAKKYQYRGLDLLDLIQQGAIGLSQGIDEFNSNKGVNFTDFINYWIELEITNSTNEVDLALYLSLNSYKRVEQTYLDFVPSSSEERESFTLIELLTQAINRLTPRQQIVITSRYLQDDPDPRRKIAASLKISGEMVRKIEHSAIEKIKSILNAAN
jgi:RNA polymerase sigma factor (sigma-70 family)